MDSSKINEYRKRKRKHINREQKRSDRNKKLDNRSEQRESSDSGSSMEKVSSKQESQKGSPNSTYPSDILDIPNTNSTTTSTYLGEWLWSFFGY